MTSSKRKLKVGLLMNGHVVDSCVYDFIKWAVDQPDLDVSHCLIIKPPGVTGKSRWQVLREEISQRGLLEACKRRVRGRLLRTLYQTEARSLQRSGRSGRYFERHDISDLIGQTLTFTPVVSSSGFVYRLNAEDVETIRAEGFDVLLRFCDGILKGGILNAAREGVISFHHGDNRVNRGGPAGFWEVYYRQNVTGFIIQRLSEELDGGDVLLRAWVQTHPTWLRNQIHLSWVSYHYLRELLLRMTNTDYCVTPESGYPYCHPLYRSPNTTQILKYFLRRGSRAVDAKARKVLGKKARWGVAVRPGNWRNAVLHRGIPVEAPPGHFIADPFLIEHDGGDYVFVEDLDYATGKGTITVYEINKDKCRLLGTALEEDFHLSFPFLFRYDGELYMCPETSANRDVRLYKCVDFPLKWELAHVLMDEISATDTMIFEKDGLWWMMTNDDPTATGNHSLQLSIYFSDNPLSSDWRPHPANPVYLDARRARNGGLLTDGKDYYRVNQQQGFGVYGRAASINRIIELTTENFREENVADIEPEFFAGIFASHHMHSNGRYTAFDYCRWERTKPVQTSARKSEITSRSLLRQTG